MDHNVPEGEPDDNSAASGASAEPWYKVGLRFTCTQCGQCCSGGPGYVWVTEAELQQIADYLKISRGEMLMRYQRVVGSRISLREYANGDCMFLDGATRRCTIYPVRPGQCRTWPFWNSNLESEEAWQQTKDVCPGTGHGQLYTLEEITAKSGVIDI